MVEASGRTLCKKPRHIAGQASLRFQGKERVFGGMVPAQRGATSTRHGGLHGDTDGTLWGGTMASRHSACPIGGVRRCPARSPCFLEPLPALGAHPNSRGSIVLASPRLHRSGSLSRTTLKPSSTCTTTATPSDTVPSGQSFPAPWRDSTGVDCSPGALPAFAVLTAATSTCSRSHANNAACAPPVTPSARRPSASSSPGSSLNPSRTATWSSRSFGGCGRSSAAGNG